MMRDCGSVKLYWSPSRGPGTGGSVGAHQVCALSCALAPHAAPAWPHSPPARQPAAPQHELPAPLWPGPAAPGDPLAVPSPRAPPAHRGCLAGRSVRSRREQLLDLGSQLRLHLQQTLVADRVVPGGISMDLGPIQTDRPQFQHARLLCQQQHLHKEVLQFGQERAPKRGQGIMIRMLVACDETEWHCLIRGTLDLTRTEHTSRIAIEKQAQ